MNSIIFLDIETVPAAPSFDKLDERGQKLFEKKFAHELKPWTLEDTANDLYRTPIEQMLEMYRSKAGLYSEFNKIVCVSVGIVKNGIIHVKSFYDHDEKVILTGLKAMLDDKFGYNLCAYNGKGFDFPHLGRKYLIHGLKMPPMLQVAGLKPWEISLIDPQEMWRFGDFKYTASLDQLAMVFGIPSPKDDIDGSQVAGVYYSEEEDALTRIAVYCERDVVTLAKVYAKMIGDQATYTGKSATFPDAAFE